jgi:predicted  nucleic acid-binding Zn-ribbon protein
MNPMKRKQMEDRLHELEREIAQTEAAIAQCETKLQNFVNAEETQRLGQELSQSKGNLQGLMNEWEELSGTLETTG